MAEGGINPSAFSCELDGPAFEQLEEQQEQEEQKKDGNVLDSTIYYDVPIDFAQEYHYKPTVHPGQAVVRAGHHVIVWGELSPATAENSCHRENLDKKIELVSKIDVYNSYTNKWETPQIVFKGSRPPFGVRHCSVSSLDNNRVYFFGGYCGHHQCYHNNVHELQVSDIKSISWKEVLPTGNEDIKRKKESAMFCFMYKTEPHALIVGGKGFGKPSSPGDIFIPGTEGMVYTNECHIVNLKSGKVFTPSSIEGILPPASSFQLVSLTPSDQRRVTTFRAIAYGGETKDGQHKDIYIVDIDDKLNLTWTYIRAPKHDIVHWPRRRQGYAVCSLPLPHQLLLLVSGQENSDRRMQCLKECWIFNYEIKEWHNIGFPDQLVERMGHSVVAWAISPNCIRVAVIGGTTASKELVQQQFGAFEIFIGQSKRDFSCASVNLDLADDCRLKLSESIEFKKQIEGIQKIRDQAVKDYHTLSTSKLPTSKSKTDLHKKTTATTRTSTYKSVYDTRTKEIEQLKEKHKIEIEKLQKEINDKKRKTKQKSEDTLSKEQQKLKTEHDQLVLKYEELEKEKKEDKEIYEDELSELIKTNEKLQLENQELKEAKKSDQEKEILIEKKKLLKELLDKFDEVK